MNGNAMKATLARYFDDGKTSQQDRHEAVLAGLPASEVTRFLSSFKFISKSELLTALELHGSVSPGQKNSKLSREESGAVMDLGCVLHIAARILGSVEAAEYWLRQPSVAFGGHRPLDFFSTRQGGQLLHDHLVRLEFGVYM
jgi:putative toxin-antitoxin system antitoxin component (TIGR02293 family)